MNSSRQTTIVGYTILLVWAVVAIAGLVTRDYQALTYVTPVMLIFAGFLFGDRVVFKRKDNGN